MCLIIFYSKNSSFTYCSACIITYGDKIKEFYVLVSIRQTFKGYRQPLKVKNHIRFCNSTKRAFKYNISAIKPIILATSLVIIHKY